MKPLNVQLSPENKTLSEQLSSLPPQILEQIIDEQKQSGADSVEDFLATSTAEDYEELVRLVMYTIPTELQSRHITDYIKEGLTLGQSFSRVFQLMEARGSGWEYEGNETHEKELVDTILFFNGFRYDMESFLGQGKAGYVFASPDHNNICVKYLHTPKGQPNSAEREFRIMQDAHSASLSFSTIAVPKPHAFARNRAADKSFFSMENIDGYTLQEIIDLSKTPDGQKRLEEEFGLGLGTLCSNFDDTALRNNIDSDLERMHRSGIIHGDIFTTNIMVRKRDSKIYLIDFGDSALEATIDTTAEYDQIEHVKQADILAFRNALTVASKDIKHNLTNT